MAPRDRDEPEDAPLKSAVELAMERLRARDGEEGADAPTPLTDAQRERIAEIRRRYEAKIAESRILQQASLARAVEKGDLEALEKLQDEQRQQLAEFERKRDEEIEAVRAE